MEEAALIQRLLTLQHRRVVLRLKDGSTLEGQLNCFARSVRKEKWFALIDNGINQTIYLDEIDSAREIG